MPSAFPSGEEAKLEGRKQGGDQAGGAGRHVVVGGDHHRVAAQAVGGRGRRVADHVDLRLVVVCKIKYKKVRIN